MSFILMKWKQSATAARSVVRFDGDAQKQRLDIAPQTPMSVQQSLGII